MPTSISSAVPPTTSTPSSTHPAVVKLRDGRTFSTEDILRTGAEGLIHMAEAAVLATARPEDVQELAGAIVTIGDDHADVLQGALNMARNHDLLKWPAIRCITQAPAIVVGSAPSLDDHIEAIRALSTSCLIVSAHSAAARLTRAGIVPHVVAPKERTKPYPWCLDGVPRSTIYAGMALVPDEHERFDQKVCVGDSTILARWAGIPCMPLAGPSSGTFATAVALRLTEGPVYLVGMDGCGGHYQGYSVQEWGTERFVDCYDGRQRGTNWLHDLARTATRAAQIESKRLHQVCPSAARVTGIELAPLPLIGPSLSLPTLVQTNEGADRHAAFMSCLCDLPADWQQVWVRAHVANTIADTQLERLIQGPNQPFFEALLAPLYAQLSMERRFGMADDDVVGWFREAMANMLDGLAPVAHQMRAIGEYA